MNTRMIAGFFVLVLLMGTMVAHPVEAASYELDPSHSNVIFKVKHLDIGWIYGMFLDYEGSAEYDPSEPENTSLSITIQAESIFTNQQRRDNHLKGPDFFNVNEYPTITFESTGVESAGDTTLRVTGDLTIRDQTRTITTDVVLTGSGEGPSGNFRRGFKTTFDVDRMEYGVDYMPDGIGRTIPVTVTGEMIRQ